MNKGYFIISSHAPIRQALTMLNEVHSQSMTLFVVDDDERMVGTLTDGDIRRALIAGEDVDNEVRKAMHRSFSYLTGLDEVAKLKTLRDRNIFLVPVLDNDMRVVDIIDLKARKSALPVDAVLMAGGKANDFVR